MIFNELSNTLSRFSLRRPGAELDGGCLDAPPPGRPRKFWSTGPARVNENTDNGLVTSLASLGLSKVFDCVKRKILLSKLGWYGISTHWIKNYFTGRAETVKEGRQTHDVPLGVVRGGTLGQIMFSLYANDLVSHITYRKLISYDDDSQILHSGDPNSSMLKH